jgi:hypothetical protein
MLLGVRRRPIPAATSYPISFMLAQKIVWSANQPSSIHIIAAYGTCCPEYLEIIAKFSENLPR